MVGKAVLAVIVILAVASNAHAAMDIRLVGMPESEVTIPGSFSPVIELWVDCLEGLGDVEVARANLQIETGHPHVRHDAPEHVDFTWPSCGTQPGLILATEVPFTVQVPQARAPAAHTAFTLNASVAMDAAELRSSYEAGAEATWMVQLKPLVQLALGEATTLEVGQPGTVPLVIRSASNGAVDVHMRTAKHHEMHTVPAAGVVELDLPYTPNNQAPLAINLSLEDPLNTGLVLWQGEYVLDVQVQEPTVMESPGALILAPLALLWAASKRRASLAQADHLG